MRVGYRVFIASTIIGICLVSVGCGQTGALYLPKPAPATPPQNADATVSEQTATDPAKKTKDASASPAKVGVQ